MPERKREKTTFNAWSPWVALVIVFLLYSLSWRGGFLSREDESGIVRNSYVHGFSFENLRPLISPFHKAHLEGSGEYLPLRDFSYMMDYSFWGTNPVGYHLTNTLLFMAGLFVLFCLLKQFIPRGPGAFAALLLFAFHPINAESVAWISSRKFLLAFFFFSLSFLLFLRFYRERKVGTYLASFACFLAALASYPFACVLPLFFVIALPVLGSRRQKKEFTFSAGLLRTLPFFIVAILWVFLSYNVQGSTGKSFPLFYPSTLAFPFLAAEMIWKILGRIIFPVDLCTIYQSGAGDPFSSPRMVYLVALIALVLISLFLLFRRRRGGALLCMFFVALVPFLGVYPLSQYSADRYLLIPGIAFFPIVILLFLHVRDSLGKKKRALILWGGRILFCIILIALAALTAHRERIWKNNEVFWKDTVRKATFHPSAQFQLGLVHLRAKRNEDALACFEKALALDPGFWPAAYQAGELLRSMSEPLRAKGILERAYQHNRTNRVVALEFSSALIEARLHMDAEKVLTELRKEYPDDSLILLHLGNLYLNWGDKTRGIELVEKALEDETEEDQKMTTLELLAKEYRELKRWEMAMMYYEALLGLAKDQGQQLHYQALVNNMKKRLEFEKEGE